MVQTVNNNSSSTPSNHLVETFADVCIKSLNGKGTQYVDKTLELAEALRHAELEPHVAAVIDAMYREFENAGPDLIASEL